VSAGFEPYRLWSHCYIESEEPRYMLAVIDLGADTLASSGRIASRRPRRPRRASGIELQFEREVVEFRLDSVEHALEIYETKWGPFVVVKELLERQDRRGHHQPPRLVYLATAIFVVGALLSLRALLAGGN
jgi:hypothetical protein